MSGALHPALRDRLRRGVAVEVADGRTAVFALLPELEALARRVGTPVTARAAWIRARLVAEPGLRPWALSVRADDRRLLAVAVLVPDGEAHALAAGGDGYRSTVPAVDDAAAAELGSALAAEADRRGIALALGTMPDDDVTRELADALGAEPVPSDPVPALALDQGRDLVDYLSHGTLRTLRKARNRLAADGRDAEIDVTGRPGEVTAALPGMEQAFRSRDREHGLACPLDDPLGLARWRERIRQLLEAECLELATLTVDGRLAAYVLGVRDGRTYGVLEGHFESSWARYSPGRLLESAVLARALGDPRITRVDWMTSAAPETLLAATASEPVLGVGRLPAGRRVLAAGA